MGLKFLHLVIGRFGRAAAIGVGGNGLQSARDVVVVQLRLMDLIPWVVVVQHCLVNLILSTSGAANHRATNRVVLSSSALYFELLRPARCYSAVPEPQRAHVLWMACIARKPDSYLVSRTRVVVAMLIQVKLRRVLFLFATARAI
jgi:hypothetical protein